MGTVRKFYKWTNFITNLFPTGVSEKKISTRKVLEVLIVLITNFVESDKRRERNRRMRQRLINSFSIDIPLIMFMASSSPYMYRS